MALAIMLLLLAHAAAIPARILLVASATYCNPFRDAGAGGGRAYRIGAVSVNPRNAPIIVAMFDELRRLGFIEGQNLTIDWRTYGPRAGLVSEFEGLVKTQPDVIYAAGIAGLRAAQKATTSESAIGRRLLRRRDCAEPWTVVSALFASMFDDHTIEWLNKHGYLTWGRHRQAEAIIAAVNAVIGRHR
jgi:hypothetical protein